MSQLPQFDHSACAEKRIIIRGDLNVPLKNGEILDDYRITCLLPTLKKILSAGGKPILISHLGRPKTTEFDPSLSLAPIAQYLSEHLNCAARLVTSTEWQQEAYQGPVTGTIDVWENIRFLAGETQNDPKLAQTMAKHCDIFVMDAFATAHRKHASTYGIISYAPSACAGPLLTAELETLRSFIKQPKRPCIAVVAGAKISTKLKLLERLSIQVDYLFLGGGILNTVLASMGYAVGRSLIEKSALPQAKQFIQKIQTNTLTKNAHQGCLILPVDIVVAQTIAPHAPSRIISVDSVTPKESILDIGPQSIKNLSKLIKQAGSIVWNGPIGLFEVPPFDEGTQALGQAIAENTVYSLVGGGDILTALKQFGLTDKISYTSTGGGAFLTVLEGTPLPAVAALERWQANTLYIS